jgi:hypothetical protein
MIRSIVDWTSICMEKSHDRGVISMKRLFGLVMFVLIIYVIYYDISKGTIPIAIEASTQEQTKEEVTMEQEEFTSDYFEKKVQSGDTVLSIIENHIDASLPVSIQKVITDFSGLNEGIEAEKIQIGKTYKFPDYKNLDQ